MSSQELPIRKRVLAIVNPVAGRARHGDVRTLISCLHAGGCTVTTLETTARGDAERFAAKADSSHFDVVVAAGGDGTINEVINGLAEGGLPLAILPLGIANVLAVEIGLPRSLEAIARTVIRGPSKPISLGEVNGRRFAVMASVGLDATVVEKVDLDLKRYIGKWAYLYEALRQLLTSSPSTYRIRTGSVTREAHGIIIANGRHYAGRFVAAADADLETPSLEICRMTGSGRLAVPRYLASMLSGRLAQRSDFHVDRVTDLEIIGPAGAPLQADGDILCHLPAVIKVLPAAVDLIFPPTVP